MTHPAESEYDAIAGAYKDSKQLSFRQYIEEYTLFQMLGDISGEKALDLACGEGFYTRRLKRAGAGEVLGVDVSAEMIRLAEAEERARSTGCRYLNQDAAALVLDEPVDLVVAMYLLNYARDANELPSLRPGGLRRAETGRSLRGFQRQRQERTRRHGLGRIHGRTAHHTPDTDLKRSTKERRPGQRLQRERRPGVGCPKQGRTFRRRPHCLQVFQRRRHAIRVQQLLPLTWNLSEDFRGSRLRRSFRWVDPQLHPSERDNEFWDEFMAAPPIIGFAAVRA